MPAARSVSDEPAVDTSWASHMSTKSGRRKTATDETGRAGASSLMAAKHTVRIGRIRGGRAPDTDPAERPVEGSDERTARGGVPAGAGGGGRPCGSGGTPR